MGCELLQRRGKKKETRSYKISPGITMDNRWYTIDELCLDDSRKDAIWFPGGAIGNGFCVC